MELKGKKAVVMGLGLNSGGLSSTNFLLKHGAKVLVTDLKSEEELRDELKKIKGKVELVLGKHREKDFEEADLIIRNPGVPLNSKYLEIARKNNIPIEMEVTLFFKFVKSKKIIGVTGSKGKTTTATLIYGILKKAGKKVVMAGNMGISMLGILPKIDKETWVVLEISSWQIEGLREYGFSPHIGVITNILREHMNRYKSMKEYAATKMDLFKFQGEGDFAIINKEKGYKANFKIARKVAKILGIKKEVADQVFKDFKGIPYRMEKIREVEGITFINDTTATIPDATIAAIDSLDDPMVLIAGGNDKNLLFEELGKLINKRKVRVVLLEGTATGKIEKEIDKKLLLGRFKNFKKAIKLAYKSCPKDGTVLLSPAATSFGTFINEFDRGDQFNEIVKNL